MGAFDNNIHMNGAGTTYQAFLDLADAAEEKGGRIGERTVRLVKAGDGLATTTFHGTKGDRVSQIRQAREAFLNAISREFGYAARSIAEKTLGNGAGQEPVPLTARSIRAVNDALGNKAALAESSKLVRENKMGFDTMVSFVFSELSPRMGTTKAELDPERIQAEALKLIEKGTFANDGDGLQAAVRDVAAKRVAVAARMESLLRAHAPEHLVRRLAETVLDEAVAIVDDVSVPDGDGVDRKLRALAATCIEKDQDIFRRDAIAGAMVYDGEKLVTDMFGADALQDKKVQKALEILQSRLANLQNEKIGLDAFKDRCAKAVDGTIRSCIVQMLGKEMMLEDSENPSYGRVGVRLYDALGVGKGPNDRRINDYYFWKMGTNDGLETRCHLENKGPDELRKAAFDLVFKSIAVDYAEKLPPLPNEHPRLKGAKLAIANNVANGLAERFETAVTDDDFAKLADDFKAQLAAALDKANTTLRNIDLAMDQAKAEVMGRLEQMAGENGFTVTQGIQDKAFGLLSDARDSLRQGVPEMDKALSVDECKAKILGRIEKKWLSPCRQAAAEIGASALDPAQKKAFLAKVMESDVNAMHVRIALRAVPAFDVQGLVDAAKSGDGRKLAEQFLRFVGTTDANVTDADELKSIFGADDFTACVGTSMELLLILNPGIGNGIRALDADTREKLFDDAAEMSMGKSSELQNQKRIGLNEEQSKALLLNARNWSLTTSCIMQLQQAVG